MYSPNAHFPAPRRLLLFLMLTTSFVAYAQNEVLEVTEGQYGLDAGRQLILVQLPYDQVPLNLQVLNTPEGRFTANASLTADHRPGGFPVTRSDGTSFTLYFTALPLITIHSAAEIVNEPKVPTSFTYCDGEELVLTTGGIELRGASQLGQPKGSFDLELDEDERFGHLRNDDDWVLDGVYNEIIRLNSYVAYRLWLRQHTPYYLDREPRAKAGADVALTEVFLNGRYHGLHLLSEQVDRKLLRLVHQDADGAVRGQLYKSYNSRDGTRFEAGAPAPTDDSDRWAGFEQKYPRPRDTVSFTNLNRLYDFVVHSSDEAFRAEIGNYIHLNNAVDYLLFVNLAGLWDNVANNLITARYDAGEPYFFAPWDLDGAFGNHPGAGCNEYQIDFWYDNGLFDRLVALNAAGFNDRLCERWRFLRTQGAFTDEQLEGLFRDTHATLLAEGVYDREALVWGGPRLNHQPEQLAFAERWIRGRLAVLDRVVCDLQDNKNSLAEDPDHCITIFPNPAATQLTLNLPTVEETRYRVYDFAGRLLLEDRATGPVTLDVSGWAAGTYFMRVAHRRLVFVIR